MKYFLDNLLYLGQTPAGWILYSGVFFWFITRKLEISKIILYLKYYCIIMMPLAIEALIRSMIYVQGLWGIKETSIIFLFLVISVLVLCFCVLTLCTKFASRITRRIYANFTLIMIIAIIIFPFVSLVFEASLQAISVWGCTAIALYGIREYTYVDDEEEIKQEKRRLLKDMLIFCLALPIWMLFIYSNLGTNPAHVKNIRAHYEVAIYKYHKSNPGAIYEFPPEEAVDVTDRLNIIDSIYARTGAVSVVLKNRVFSFQINIEKWIHCNRGVPWLGLGAFREMSLEDNKKQLARGNTNNNTPDLNSIYDGIGDVFYWRITGQIE